MENKQERKVDGIRGGWSTERECLTEEQRLVIDRYTEAKL